MNIISENKTPKNVNYLFLNSPNTNSKYFFEINNIILIFYHLILM